MIRRATFAVVNTGTCFLPTFHPERPATCQGDDGKTVKLLIVDSSTCFGATFHPNAPQAFFSTRYEAVPSLVNISMTEKGLVKQEVASTLIKELRLACEEIGIRDIELQVGDQVHSPGCVFTEAYTPSSGKMLVDFSTTFENDWKVFGASRENMNVLVRHELAHIKAIGQAVWASPEAAGLPSWFAVLLAKPIAEAGAHLMSPRDLVERYLHLTVESSIVSFRDFDRSSLRQLVDAVAVIATVAGTVEEFGLDTNLVEKLFRASDLSDDPFVSRAVDVSKDAQLEFYTQRRAGIQSVLLTNESQDIWDCWTDHLRQTGGIP